MIRFGKTVLAILILASILVPGLRAQETPKRDKLVMTAVAAFLEHAHLSERPLDDSVGRTAFITLFSNLDPLKLYFVESDVREFAKRETEIDDMLSNGKPEFAHEVWDRFLLRVAERVACVEKLLKGEFEFDKEETFTTDPEATVWAKATAELDDRWRRRIKYDLLALRLDEVKDEEARKRLHTRYTRFGDRIKKESNDEILARFINAITTSYDPHTNYMPPKNFDDFQMGVTLNYQGIGALLADEDGIITISRVIPGGPVEKYGKIKAKDAILAVAQDEGEFTELHGMRITDVVKLIRGKEGSTVRLRIRPAKGGPTKVHSIVRNRVELADSAAKSEVVEHGKKPDGSPLKIGMINLPSFYRDLDGEEAGKKDFRSSTRDIRNFLTEYKKTGVDAVILDLRLNGGGFLQEAIDIAGLFIDAGTMVQVKGGGDSRIRELKDRDGKTFWDGPLVVLTSRSSASASEIVAGAVKDYQRGLVIGDSTTHGKGTVQTPIDLSRRLNLPKDFPSLGVIKVTMQQFYRPDGSSTQILGVPSDVQIPSFTDVVDEGESELPHAVPHKSIRAARHRDLDLVDARMVDELARNSAKRRKASPYFNRLEKRIAAYVEFKKMEKIPLEEKAYRALQARLDAKDDEEETPAKDEKAEEGKDAKEKKKSPWILEALDITADYVALLRGRA